MNRRAIVWFAVVAAAIVVTAAPASAATTSFVRTSDTDFQQATLSNMEIVGSGDSASVDTQLGTQTATTLTQSSTSRDDAERGVRFTVSETTDEIEVVRFSESSITTYELRTSGGTTIASGSAFGQTTFNFDQTTFQPGTTYEILFGDGGDEYDSVVASESPPVDNGVVNITGGVNFAQTVSTLYNVKSIAPVEPSSAQYQSPSVSTEAQSVFANVTLANAQATIEAQRNTGSGWTTVNSTTVTSSGNYSLSASGSGEWRTVVDFSNDSGVSSGTVEAEGVVATTNAPTLSNPDPPDGANLDTFEDEVSVQVNDSDFALSQGDQILVTARDGSGDVIGQQTVSSNSTVTFSYEAVAGTNHANWTADDDYSNSDTLNTSWEAPTSVTIRDVETGNVVDNVQVNGTFFGSEEVFTRETTNGNISIEGLPASETFTLKIQADGYYTRRVIIDDLFTQQTAYVINKSSPQAINTTLQVDDQTGNFPSSSTRLIIQRPINESGNTTFKNVAGDYLTAADQYPATLIEDNRYRIILVTDSGLRRELGTFIPQPSQEGRIVQFTVSSSSVSLQEGETYAWDAQFYNRSSEPNDPQIKFSFEANQTVDNLRVIVYERGDRSNEIYNQSTTGIKSDTRTIVLSDTQGEKDWVVNYSATYAGNAIGGEKIVGDDRFQIGVPLDSTWKYYGSILGLLLFGAAFGGVRAELGGMAAASGAAIFLLMGWLPPEIGGLAIAGGFAFSTMLLIGGSR